MALDLPQNINELAILSHRKKPVTYSIHLLTDLFHLFDFHTPCKKLNKQGNPNHRKNFNIKSKQTKMHLKNLRDDPVVLFSWKLYLIAKKINRNKNSYKYKQVKQIQTSKTDANKYSVLAQLYFAGGNFLHFYKYSQSVISFDAQY